MKGGKEKVKEVIEHLKADLLLLSEEEIDRLFKEIKEVKKRQRVKTIPVEQLESLVGAISVGGDAVKESEEYYE